jgi:hypothetical protein
MYSYGEFNKATATTYLLNVLRICKNDCDWRKGKIWGGKWRIMAYLNREIM